MRLLSPASSRFVLLVVDPEGRRPAPRLDDAEIVACPSSEAAESALLSGRRYSAVIADGVPAGLTSGLAAAAARTGTPLIGPSGPDQLAARVRAVAHPVPRADDPLPGDWMVPGDTRPGRGRLVAVCGPGATGASTIAAALAAGVGAACSRGGGGRGGTLTPVVLADFALHADQADLHGVAEPARRLLDFLAVGRLRPLTSEDVRRLTVDQGRFRILAGLRRPQHWTAVHPDAFDAALSELLALVALVVADITGDFEGEETTGSVDVEERNHMARGSAAAADLVVVVGAPGAHGARRLASLVDDLLDLGVDPARIQPVVNRTTTEPAWPRVCGLPAPPIAVATIAGDVDGDGLLPARAGAPLAAAVAPLTAVVADLVSRCPAPRDRPPPLPVPPGSLGCAAP